MFPAGSTARIPARAEPYRGATAASVYPFQPEPTCDRPPANIFVSALPVFGVSHRFPSWSIARMSARPSPVTSPSTPAAGSGAPGTSTISVNACVTVPPALLAVTTIGYRPPAPADGVPANTPFELMSTPAGSAPDSENVGIGKPEAVTLKLPALPAWKIT